MPTSQSRRFATKGPRGVRSILAGAILTGLSFLMGCTGSRPSDPGQIGNGIVFSSDVLPLIQERFAPLLEEESGLQLDSWETLIAGSEHGGVIIPFDPENSLLVKLAESNPGAIEEADLVLIRRWIDEGARDDSGRVPYADSEELLYVCNQHAAAVSIIDMRSNLVIRTVNLQDLGFSSNARPHHIAVEPDGSFWYVSLIGENKVLKFNRQNELVGRADFEFAGMLALDATSERLFVSRSMTAVNPPQRVGIVNRETMAIDELDVFFPRPHALAVRPGGNTAYVASLAIDQIATIDPEEEAVEVSSLEQSGEHHNMLVQFAITPDAQTMIAGGEMSGALLFFRLTENGHPELVESIDLGGAPFLPVITPDGRRAYIPRKTAGAVSVVDVVNRSEVAEIEHEAISEPDGSAVRNDGRYVYVSNNNLRGGYTPRYDLGDDDPIGTVVIIDTATNAVVRVLEVGHNPTGIGARPAY